MRTAKSLIMILSLASASAHCGKTDTSTTPAIAPTIESEPAATQEPVPETEEPTREDVGEKTLAMLVKLVEISETHKGDCATTTAAFRETLERYKATLDAGKKMEEVPEDQRWFEENYSYKFNNQAMLLKEHLGACAFDLEFQKAMEELN